MLNFFLVFKCNDFLEQFRSILGSNFPCCQISLALNASTFRRTSTIFLFTGGQECLAEITLTMFLFLPHVFCLQPDKVSSWRQRSFSHQLKIKTIGLFTPRPVEPIQTRNCQIIKIYFKNIIIVCSIFATFLFVNQQYF